MRRISLIKQSYQDTLTASQREQGNSVLDVATVSFQDFQGQLLGVVLTPCFLQLLILPQEIEGWRDHQIGETHKEVFPAGEFEFSHGWDPSFGAFGCCQLFSSMAEFSDQTAALEMAELAMKLIFVERAPELVAEEDSAGSADSAELEIKTVADVASPTQTLPSSHGDADSVANETVDMKRRGLLMGSLFGRD